jgi:hypothetical protein
MNDPLLDPAVDDDVLEIGRDPNAERDADHYGPGAGGKKRKVPTFQPPGDSDRTHRQVSSSSSDSPKTFHVPNHSPRSLASNNCSFRKALYLRRKAALITLYIDAQNAIISGATKLGPNGESPLMDVPAFEKLMLSLEDLGISDWPPDRPGWRTHWPEEGAKSRIKSLEQWRAGFEQKKQRKASFKPITNAGWFPEGSFEFEVPSKGQHTLDHVTLTD